MQAYCLRFLSDGAAKVELSPAPLGIKKTQVNLHFYYSLVEPQIRLELMTCRLQGGCSTNWAIAAQW